MKIIDCVTFFDEEILLNIRLNILYDYVDKFIISEGGYDHRGKKRETKLILIIIKIFQNKMFT